MGESYTEEIRGGAITLLGRKLLNEIEIIPKGVNGVDDSIRIGEDTGIVSEQVMVGIYSSEVLDIIKSFQTVESL